MVPRRQALGSYVVAVAASGRAWHLLRHTVVVQLHDIVVGNKRPSIRAHVVQVDRIARVCIAVRSRVNAAATEIEGLLVRQVPMVALIEHTVGKC